MSLRIFMQGPKPIAREQHLRRGYCCNLGCRHCPWDFKGLGNPPITAAERQLYQLTEKQLEGQTPNPIRILNNSMNSVIFMILCLLSIYFSLPAAANANSTSSVLSKHNNAEHNNSNGCVDQYDPMRDYFPEKTKVTHAQSLHIEYHPNFKVVRVVNPWKKAQVSFEYVLVQCGTPPPKGYPHAQIISVPIKSMIVMSTVYLGFVNALKLHDNLIGIANFKAVNSPSILALIKQGKLVETGNNFNEKILQLNPDLIVTYSMGNASTESHLPSMKMGLKVALNGDYMETSALGRAEWLKFMAVMFNKETEANQYFEHLQDEYQRMVELAKSIEHRPTVFVGMNYRGVWHMAGGKSFMAALFKDAGADYLWADAPETDHINLDLETVLAKAGQADYWFNSGMWTTLKEGLLEDSRYLYFKAFERHQVYNHNAITNQYGASDYWESAIVNPHLLLRDMIKIFHPQLVPQHSLIWYHALK